jgi:adenylosuccinate lyase
MIPRYSTPEMEAIWDDEARMAAWLQVELAVCEAWTRLGRIPEGAMVEIREKAAFDVDRVNEIEQTTQHDVIAFVSCVAENVGEASKHIHYGLTSSDVLDTGLALQLRAAGALLAEETRRLGVILQRRRWSTVTR